MTSLWCELSLTVYFLKRFTWKGVLNQKIEAIGVGLIFLGKNVKNKVEIYTLFCYFSLRRLQSTFFYFLKEFF